MQLIVLSGVSFFICLMQSLENGTACPYSLPVVALHLFIPFFSFSLLLKEDAEVVLHAISDLHWEN